MGAVTLIITLMRKLIDLIFYTIAFIFYRVIFWPKQLIKKLQRNTKTLKAPLNQDKQTASISLSYQPKAFMTKNELKFFYALYKAVNQSYHVMAKVRVADVLEPNSDSSERLSLFNRIRSKHFDYILLDKEYGKNVRFVCAIELDDPSHQREDRRKRDSFLNDICRDAGICLIRFKYTEYQNFYSSLKLRQVILDALENMDAPPSKETPYSSVYNSQPKEGNKTPSM